MWIEKLELQNIKCFENKTFEFSPGFNLIIGKNGTGKTSIIDALLFTFSNIDITKAEINPEKIVSRKSKNVNSSTPNIEFIFPSIIKASINPLNIFSLKIGDSFTCQILDKQGAYTGHASVSTYNFLSSFQNYPVIALYKTSRRVHTEKIPIESTLSTTKRIDGYTSWHNIDVNFKQIYLWIKTLEISALQRQQKNPLLESIRSAIKTCMPHDQIAHVYYDLLINEICVQDNLDNIKPFDLLSDGQSSILSIVMDIAIRCAILNPHLGEETLYQTPGIVIIDEIDLHLHPAWQMRIVDDLKRTFPKIQFIATTHSPLIIQSLKPEDGDRLIDLNDPDTVPDYEYSGRSPEDILEEGMGIEMPQRSHRWKEMYHAAEEYYELLDKAESADETERLALREKLDTLMIPYDNNPAYAAYTSFLKQKRIVTGIDKA